METAKSKLDIFYDVALQIKLSCGDDYIFAGGFSEVIQGYKEQTEDIDLIVPNLLKISKLGPVYLKQNVRLGCKTGFIILNGVKIEVSESEDNFRNDNLKSIICKGFRVLSLPRIIKGKRFQYSFMKTKERRSKSRKDLIRLLRIKLKK